MDKLRSDPLFEHKVSLFYKTVISKKKTLKSNQLIRDLKVRRRRRQRERHKSSRFFKTSKLLK